MARMILHLSLSLSLDHFHIKSENNKYIFLSLPGKPKAIPYLSQLLSLLPVTICERCAASSTRGDGNDPTRQRFPVLQKTLEHSHLLQRVPGRIHLFTATHGPDNIKHNQSQPSERTECLKFQCCGAGPFLTCSGSRYFFFAGSGSFSYKKKG